jgi:hypothetical protein
MNKVAVDQAAKDYWKLLWKDYGEALVRDIPRRLKAALVDNKKVASVNETATLIPVAHARSGDEIHIEGIYKDKGAKLMFHASLDKDGNVKELKSFDLR